MTTLSTALGAITARRLLLSAALPRAIVELSSRAVTVALEAGPGKEPPKEFRVFGMGTCETSKGPLLFDDVAGQMVMTGFANHGNDLSIDYEHQALQDPPMAAPAAGWFVPELRAEGLYATNVRWTPKAAGHLSAGEYRYFSPAVEFDPETGRVMRLINLALTNLPATRAMTPLVAATDKPGQPGNQETPPMKTLIAALSTLTAVPLKETASEAEALSALNGLGAKLSTAETARAAAEGELLALTGAKSPSEARGTLEAWKQAHGQVATLSAELGALRKEKADLAAAKVASEVDAMIEAAIKEGKVTPAQKALFTEKGKADPEFLKAFLSTAVKVIPAPSGEPKKPITTVVLSDADKAVAKAMKLTEEQFAETKARLGGAN